MGHWWTRAESAEAPSGAGTPTAPVEAGWRTLPPIQRVLTPTPAVAPLHTFASSLVTAQNPSFLAPLGHSLDLAGPSGQVDGLAAPVPTTYAAADPLPLNVEAETPGRGHRMLAGPVAQRVLSSPVAQRALTSAAAQLVSGIPGVSRVLDSVTAASPPAATPSVITGPTADPAGTPDAPGPSVENPSLAEHGETDDPALTTLATVGSPPEGPAAPPEGVQRTVAPAAAPPPIATALPLLGELSDASPVPLPVATGVPSPTPVTALDSTSPLAAAVTPVVNAPAGRPAGIEPALVQRTIAAATAPVLTVPPTPAAMRPTSPVVQRLSTDPGSGVRTTAPSHAAEPAHQNSAPAGPTPPAPGSEAPGLAPARPLLTGSEPQVDIDNDVPAAVRFGEQVDAPVQRATEMPALIGLEHLLGGAGAVDAAPARSVARARIGLPVVPSTAAHTPSSAGTSLQRTVLGRPDPTEWSATPRSDTGVSRPADPLAMSIDRRVASLPTAALGPRASAVPPVGSRIADPAGAELGSSLSIAPAWPTVSRMAESGPALPTLSRDAEIGAPPLPGAVDATLHEPYAALGDPAPADGAGPVQPSFPLASVPLAPVATPAAVSRPLLAQRLVDPAPALMGAFHPAPGVPVADLPTLSVVDAPPLSGRTSSMHSGPLAAATPGPVAQRIDSAFATALGSPSLEPGMTVLRSIDAPNAGPVPASLPSLSRVVPTGAYPLLSPTSVGPTASARSLPLAMSTPAPVLAGDAAVNVGVAQRMADNSVEFAPPTGSSGPAYDAPVQRLADPPMVQTASAGPAPAGGEGALPTDLDELARRLFDPLSARLKTELWLDRERAGLISELRR